MPFHEKYCEDDVYRKIIEEMKTDPVPVKSSFNSSLKLGALKNYQKEKSLQCRARIPAMMKARTAMIPTLLSVLAIQSIRRLRKTFCAVF
ncbi:hypothetical protein V3C99_011580 [Haemonchus contortus]